MLIDGNAKSLRLKSNLQKDIVASVYLFEAPSSPRFSSRGGHWATNFVGSQSGHNRVYYKSPAENGLLSQSNELNRGTTELVMHCRLQGELTSAQEHCLTYI
jgi:hypothetical protein